MRLSSATVLLGTTSVLSALLVSAAPVLVRISFIESIKASSEQDDFFRFVRIGGPGATANIHTPDLESINAAILSSGILDNIDPDAIVKIEGEQHLPVTMRPELEFTPPELQFDASNVQESLDCSRNLWQRVFGNLNDFFMDLFGFVDELRSTQCGKSQAASSPQQPAFLASPIPSVSVYGSMPYHRNGSPIGVMQESGPVAPGRFRPGGWRHRPTSFSGRIQRALYALSPWEGRAVAFVMGCGLGVLLRMLFVFVVLGARMLSGSSRPAREEDEEKVIVMFGDEEVEGVVLFDAASIKGASVEDLLYEEKQ